MSALSRAVISYQAQKRYCDALHLCFVQFIILSCLLMEKTLLCSDGNMVASFLSHALHIPQANIAHALEKVPSLPAALNLVILLLQAWSQFPRLTFLDLCQRERLSCKTIESI